MLEVLKELRKKVVTGVVSGSDFVKISEQLSTGSTNGMCSDLEILHLIMRIYFQL